ncbi:MAG: type II secretion system protein N, partial [Burkholderiales bacterium]
FTTPRDTAAAPASTRASSPTTTVIGETIAASGLFGVNARAPTQVAQVSTLNVKLKGVFASNGKTIGAILNNGQKDEFVTAGAEVVPGVTLEEVYPTHVVLKRGGAVERVNLEERAGTGGGIGPRAAPPRLGAGAPRFNPPVVQGLPPIIPPPPPRPSFGGAPPQPQQNPGALPQTIPSVPPSPPAQPVVPGFTAPPGGNASMSGFTVGANGITVGQVPAGSPLARVGLQAGDVVKSVNGQAMTSQADVARLAQLAGTGQPLRGEIIRAGKIVPLTVSGGR